MKRATQLFTFDDWAPRSRYVHRIWRTRSAPEPAFLSVAESRSEIVVTTRRGTTEITVRGPETHATAVAIPPDAEFFGIQFALGAYLATLPPSTLVDETVWVRASGRSFALDGREWEVPT